MTTFDVIETSRSLGEPVNLYLFKGADPTLESLVRSMTLIPGTTEFGYGTTAVTRDSVTLNAVAGLPTTDIIAALNELSASAPNLRQVSLVVSWHGDDLRAGNCLIKPRVQTATGTETPYAWQSGPVTRGSAVVASAAIGGAPADRSIFEAIAEIRARGWAVTVYPRLVMDLPSGNSLPNPYGGTGQPVYPSRSLITCSPAIGQGGTVDKTSTAATQVSAFFGAATAAQFGWDGTSKTVTFSGTSTEWSYRRFVLHMARIAAAAGAERFLLGSELVGLTRVRSDATTFPAVGALVSLAAEVRTLVGSGVEISYGADWSEYHGYRPADGSGDVFFHLDPLWSDANIDFVGIDNYLPISDWRDGVTHADRLDGYVTLYDKRYLSANIEGGEYFDWTYLSGADRDDQVRTQIDDPTSTEDWVYRDKDIRSWWLNSHHNRPAGVRSASATAWVPQSKPIVFTEIGIPAVNNGTNQPASVTPFYSTGAQDQTLQRTALEALLTYWKPETGNNPVSTVYDAPMVEWESASVQTWDARPYPTFPQQATVWPDAAAHSTGHWITGRIDPGIAFDPGIIGPYAYTDAEQPIVRDGITYQPIPITRSNITASGSLDKAGLTVQMPQNTEIAELFKIYPPSSVINLFIFQGHVDLDPDKYFKAAWTGRVLGCSKESSEAKLSCEPVPTSMRRNMLRRCYQLGCPHVLYGEQCRADKTAATVTGNVASSGYGRITLESGWVQSGFTAADYLGGMVEWTKVDGSRHVRTIRKINGGVELVTSGDVNGVGDQVLLVRGCNHLMSGCNAHHNIWNFGGQPWIPHVNPLKNVSIYY